MKKLLKKVLKFLLLKPVTSIANAVSSSPKQQNVNKALSDLYESITTEPGKKGPLIEFKPDEHPVIIFSDMHKGARDGSDDFAIAEDNYLAALQYYDDQRFYFIDLGDSEELWENTIFSVIKHNKATFEKERLFADRKAFAKIFGNHDLFWDNDPLAPLHLKNMYGQEVKIFTGIVLRTALPNGTIDIFCTHGHQGDAQSDGNAFSKWFVSYVWGPLQSFLEINTNSPSSSDSKKTLHNQYMYDWSSAQKNLLLVTGHTHQPVFNSLTHLERLYLDLENAQQKNDEAFIRKLSAEIPRRSREYNFVNNSFKTMKPGYFNAGCCCYADGNITGLEIADGYMRLVKWTKKDGIPTRVVAEEVLLTSLAELVS
jgi:predicted phosphodiesterase